MKKYFEKKIEYAGQTLTIKDVIKDNIDDFDIPLVQDIIDNGYNEGTEFVFTDEGEWFTIDGKPYEYTSGRLYNLDEE